MSCEPAYAVHSSANGPKLVKIVRRDRSGSRFYRTRVNSRNLRLARNVQCSLPELTFGLLPRSAKTTFLFNVEDMASSWTGLGQLPLEPRQSLEEVTDEAISGHLEDRRLFVLVDRDDDLRSPHAREVLDGPGDPDRDGAIGRTLPAWPTCQSFGAQLASTAAREALIAAPSWSPIGSTWALKFSAEPSTRPARDNNPRRGLLGPIRLRDFLALELRHVRVLGRIHRHDRGRATFAHR